VHTAARLVSGKMSLFHAEYLMNERHFKTVTSFASSLAYHTEKTDSLKGNPYVIESPTTYNLSEHVFDQ
jgi:hypothetical protein